MAGLAHPAAAAGDVEGDGADVALLDELDVLADLDDLPCDLVAENHVAAWKARASAHHVLVAAADVGAHHLIDAERQEERGGGSMSTKGWSSSSPLLAWCFAVSNALLIAGEQGSGRRLRQHLEDDSVLALAPLALRDDRAQRGVELELGEVDGLDLDVAWAHVDDAAVPGVAGVVAGTCGSSRWRGFGARGRRGRQPRDDGLQSDSQTNERSHGMLFVSL